MAKLTFSADVRMMVRRGAAGYCTAPGCVNPGLEFHHRVANTVTNNKLYPLFLHSIFNCAFVCRDCHSNHNYVFNINPLFTRAYEAYLSMIGKGKDGTVQKKAKKAKHA